MSKEGSEVLDDYRNEFRHATLQQPIPLPQTRLQFEAWAERLFHVSGIQDTPDHRMVLAQTIQRLPPDEITFPFSHFETALRKSDANMVAYLVILECKQAEKKFEQEQEAKLKALSEQNAPKDEEGHETHVAPV